MLPHGMQACQLISALVWLQEASSSQTLLRGKPLNLPQPPPLEQQQQQQQQGEKAIGIESQTVKQQEGTLTGQGQVAKQPPFGEDGLHTAASKTAEALKADAVGGSILAGAQQAQQVCTNTAAP